MILDYSKFEEGHPPSGNISTTNTIPRVQNSYLKEMNIKSSDQLMVARFLCVNLLWSFTGN